MNKCQHKGKNRRKGGPGGVRIHCLGPETAEFSAVRSIERREREREMVISFHCFVQDTQKVRKEEPFGRAMNAMNERKRPFKTNTSITTSRTTNALIIIILVWCGCAYKEFPAHTNGGRTNSKSPLFELWFKVKEIFWKSSSYSVEALRTHSHKERKRRKAFYCMRNQKKWSEPLSSTDNMAEGARRQAMNVCTIEKLLQRWNQNASFKCRRTTSGLYKWKSSSW